MGSIYRRKVRYCTTCEVRLDTTAAWTRCRDADHTIDVREQPVWWIRYAVDGKAQCLSSQSEDRQVAEELLKQREAGETPSTVPPSAEGITFDEAAADLIADYTINKKRSLRTLTLRINKHLRPFFGGHPLAITASALRAFVTKRQAEGAANATINRDLITLKRMLTLAVQGEKLAKKPYVALLKEQNVRRGFFEPAEFHQIIEHLPVHMRGIARFAYITGWRTPSEILPLEWRQVDMQAGEIRLDAGTTKNGEARTFPFTSELRRLLEDQQQLAVGLKRDKGVTTPFVFCHLVGVKAGKRISESAYIHQWWKSRVAAGCPRRIPHDFRRTAVRNLVRAGVPERVAMQLTGHKTRAVFERYNIVSPGDLRDAAQRLDAFAASATP